MTEQLAAARAHGLLHDVARCLALGSQGRLHVTAWGHLRPPSHKLVELHTDGAPQAERLGAPNRAYRSLLLGLLGQAGMLGAIGTCLRLSAEADAWLGLPADRQILQLGQVWLLAPDLAWR